MRGSCLPNDISFLFLGKSTTILALFWIRRQKINFSHYTLEICIFVPHCFVSRVLLFYIMSQCGTWPFVSVWYPVPTSRTWKNWTGYVIWSANLRPFVHLASEEENPSNHLCLLGKMALFGRRVARDAMHRDRSVGRVCGSSHFLCF